MNKEILVVHDDTSPNYPINGRELHEQLGVETPYHKWFPRMCEYGFEAGKDFLTEDKNVRRADGTLMPQTQSDHMLTLSMAKEICMIQRNEAGRAIRRYLIEVENAWNSPEQIMSRALRIAEENISKLRGKVLHLEATNSELTVQKQIMQPKADYFDELVDRNLLTNFRDTAKQLGVKEKAFIRFLIDHKYIYRDKSGNLKPLAGRGDGLFELKESFNEKTSWRGVQTLITPKGRETFRLLTQGI